MKRNIKGGLYLVVDPVIELNELLPRMEKAIQGGIDVIQVWNNWRKGQDKAQIVEAICTIVHRHDIPVIINEEWELMLSTPVDGVHFDAIPTDLNTIRQKIGRAFLCGLTCGNDLSRVQWAEENRMTYISFCSLFPSPSAGVCEIVKKETVQQARQLTALPIFLAGG
ncbi:MAG: thiamine phosphate synthase, partial [Flavisolibacter sp.]